MPRLLPPGKRIPAAGSPPKRIEEFVGHASTGDDAVSIALMQSHRLGGAGPAA
jgi:hypothetical protein